MKLPQVKLAVTTAVIGAAGAVAGFFGAPVVGVVGAGIAMSWGINFLDKKFKATENLKHGVNSMIKGIRGGENERYNKKLHSKSIQNKEQEKNNNLNNKKRLVYTFSYILIADFLLCIW